MSSSSHSRLATGWFAAGCRASPGGRHSWILSDCSSSCPIRTISSWCRRISSHSSLVMSLKFISMPPVWRKPLLDPSESFKWRSSATADTLSPKGQSRYLFSPLWHPMLFPNLAPGTRLLWIPPVPDDRRAPVLPSNFPDHSCRRGTGFHLPVSCRSSRLRRHSAGVFLHAACQSIGQRAVQLQENVTAAGRRRITCAVHGTRNHLQRLSLRLAADPSAHRGQGRCFSTLQLETNDAAWPVVTREAVAVPQRTRLCCYGRAMSLATTGSSSPVTDGCPLVIRATQK